MAAAAAVDALLEELAGQHRRLLDDIREQSIRLLQAENRQLTEELALARKSAKKAPPVPRLPSDLDAFETAFLELIEAESNNGSESRRKSNSAAQVKILGSSKIPKLPLAAERTEPCNDMAVDTPQQPPPVVQLHLPGSVSATEEQTAPLKAKAGQECAIVLPKKVRQHSPPPPVPANPPPPLAPRPSSPSGGWEASAAQKVIAERPPFLTVGTVPQSPKIMSLSDAETTVTPFDHEKDSDANGSTLALRMSYATRRSETLMLSKGLADDLENKAVSKQCKKFRAMFCLNSDDEHVRADCIYKKVKERLPKEEFSKEEVIVALGVFRQRFEGVENGFDQEDAINVRALAEATVQYETIMDDVTDASVRAAIEYIARALNLTTIDDVIESAARKIIPMDTLASDWERLEKYGVSRWELIMNAVVSVTVILNIFCMGVSIDFQADNPGWLAFECLCTAVFISEAAIKLCMGGVVQYFFGPSASWNIMDLVVTGISVLEVSLSIWLQYMGQELSAGSRAAAASRIAVMLRMLRMVRLIRLMKLVHSPFLKDLANMLVGFVIGLPSLVWVLVLFLLVLYMMGLLFRITLGPRDDQNLISECGYPDDYPDMFDSTCKVHWMYGEEFFPSVKTAMFTTFRFMIGDYSTRGGKSLAVAFSQGYGDFFHLIFVVGMITVQFGLFNIITAIFVDSTISGLKNNDVKRKYARQYEAKFVKEKLKDLLERIGYLALTRKFKKERNKNGNLKRSRAQRVMEKLGLASAEVQASRVLTAEQVQRLSRCDIEELEINEELFLLVLEDEAVKMLLQDLDVDVSNPTDLFGTFDPDESGTVTVPEMVQAVIKLRGEPAKNDVIATVVSIKSLHEKFDNLKEVVMDIVRTGGSEALRMETAMTCTRSAP